MSDTSVSGKNIPLGVGDIVSNAFSILFGNFVPVITMALVPTLIGIAISGSLTSFEVALGLADPDFTDPGSGVGFVVSTLVSLVIYAVTTGLLVQLAYDAKLGRPLQYNLYVNRAMGAALPIALLSLAAGILTGLASIALIIPGLWVYAVFSVMAPAVVIERVGFGGLGRSAQLTKEYRWPILGALILMGIIGFVINFAAGILAAVTGSLLVAVILIALLSSVTYGLTGITVALIYARLREVKEGMSVDEIAKVFD